MAAAAGNFMTDGDRLIEGLAVGGVGVWRWAVNTDRLYWSPNLENLHALPPGSFDGTLSSFQNDVHPEDAQHVWGQIQRALETGEPYRATYRTAGVRPSGELWIEATGNIVEAEDGTRFLTGVCMDVTARVRAEKELEQRLRQQKAVGEFGAFAFGEPSLNRVMAKACELAAEVLDVPLTKILRFAGSADHLVLAAGVGWQDGLVGKGTVGTELASQAGYTLVSPEPVIVEDLLTETRFNGPDLLHRHNVRSGMSVVIPGSSSRPFGVFGVHATEVRRFTPADTEFLVSLVTIVANSARNNEAAEHRLLLVREMAHRAGNMLQLVSTIANQTFSDTENVAAARRAFSERLGSLSRANYLVAKGGWTSTRFSELLRETLNPFADKLDMSGRDVLLPPELCFDLGLVVHELATNAVKYGSLGDGGGKACLSWDIERGDGAQSWLIFSWHDPVNREARTGAPRKGFGSRLLDGLVTQKWGGTIEVRREAGYTMTARIPFDPV